jgi:hypothetical protein
MGYIVVFEAAQHMDYGIGGAYVAKKFVAKALAFGCSFDEACYINNLDGGRHHAGGMLYLDEFVEAFVGHGDYAHVRLYGAEWEVGGLCFGIAEAVEKG